MDRRVKYTKMVLRESLLTLMQTKPISRITLTELCRTADINRNTFYSHYSTVKDLLSSIEQELYTEVKDSIERSLKIESIRAMTVEICHSIKRNLSLCRVLFSEHGDTRFLKQIMYLGRDRSLLEWRRASAKGNAEELELLYTFFANGSVAVIQQWIQRGAGEDPEEIADFIDRVSKRGLRAFLSKT